MVDHGKPPADRRAELAATWLGSLTNSTPGARPFLARREDGKVFVLEGGVKREVKSGIIAAALEDEFGACLDMTETELRSKPDGAPVELFEDSDGRPFLLIEGQIRRARGVPLTYPVSNHQLSGVARGPDIDVAAANVSRRQLRLAMSGQFQVDRLRAAVKRKGILQTTKTAGQRGMRALKKRIAR